MKNNNLNYLFVTGVGRSGTTFLSRLLSHVENAKTYHEYVGNREYWLLSWYLGGEIYSKPFLEQKKKIIDREFSGEEWFIDINPYLRFSTAELAQVFETNNILHLARNPKQVISSIYTRRNDNDIHLLPNTRTDVCKWLEEDRFYQICWNWQNVIRDLLDKKVPIIRLESLIGDYSYLEEKLLKPFNFELSKKTWDTVKNKKANKTKSPTYRLLYGVIRNKPYQKETLGNFETWSSRYKSIFQELFGELAEDLGY
ncbi:MAG: sulfotransferase [Bacteroidetes bacterium]|nr:sulfotransferase [Bacteroidota bacterium]